MSKKIVIDEENPSAEAMAVIAMAISGQAHKIKTSIERYHFLGNPEYLEEACQEYKSVRHWLFLLGEGLGKEGLKLRERLYGKVD